MTSAYAALLKRQRNSSAAFVRWTSPHRRAHEFAWMEPAKEALMFAGRDIRVGPESSGYESLNKKMATIALNPYERELLYGYPYVVGQLEGIPIRAPLLTTAGLQSLAPSEMVNRGFLCCHNGARSKGLRIYTSQSH